jgi:nitroimidazol reductase NimA-like FMN-containing flavoprotein (pyridoxamine 5'-phosphate oxidase superfamily)
MNLAMSSDCRERFLADPHVGVLGVTDSRAPSAPLLVPVWYGYEGGVVTVQTARASIKAELIRVAGRFSLCVQSESPPYRYVSVEGPVVAVEARLRRAEWEAMAHRYLDPDTAVAYLRANEDQMEESLTFRMRPERWRTADFAAFAQQFS